MSYEEKHPVKVKPLKMKFLFGHRFPGYLWGGLEQVPAWLNSWLPNDCLGCYDEVLGTTYMYTSRLSALHTSVAFICGRNKIINGGSATSRSPEILATRLLLPCYG